MLLIPIWNHLRNQTFRALRVYPNFRLYWSGALTSNMGTWIQTVAQGWLVYSLTGSPLYLGFISFLTAIPNLFLALLGGALADRFERRRLMVVTQTASMVLAFVLSYLTLSGTVQVWHIAVIAFLNGIVFSLNTPVRQSIISDLVPRNDLTNAIALGSFQFQTSRMVGPALAGIIVAAFGPGWCFFINGASFLAVIWALLAMQVPPQANARRQSLWRNMLEGLRYVRTSPIIVTLVGLAVVPSLLALPYTTLMPAFASSVLNVGPEGYGLLMSSSGLGAVVGALSVASL
ncbi:MAG: MFS transporter, partial [Chloroflexi bacterium]|nr:MFS transporter [Chloroflexota bacterium]